MGPYETLGVSRSASDKDIKKAFKSKAQKAHPDRKDGDSETFQALTKAYELLSDHERRERYDATGDTQAPPSDEVQVEQMLMFIFNSMLGQGQTHGDLVKKMSDALTTQHTQASQQKITVVSAIARFEKFKGRIETEGHNPFEGLVDQKIREEQRKLEQLDEKLRIMGLAQERLTACKDVRPEAEPMTTYTPWAG